MFITGLGEFGLIQRLSKKPKLDSGVIKGPGDDCAVLKFDKLRYQLFTCDMMVEGVDFTLRDTPYLIGRKAVAISISDIAACGGKPRYCLISLGLPKNTRLDFIDRLKKGMDDIAGQYGVSIVGGDISRAQKLIIDVSMLGEVEKKNLVLRSGSRKGDIIFVTGQLGGSIRGRHLRFRPRLKEARFLVNNFKVNSMIDISDGLAQDLGHILKQSSTGAVIYECLIPVSKDAKNLNDALYTGEDFELLFTLSHNEAKKLLKKRLKIFRPIGEIMDKKSGLRLLDKRSRQRRIPNKGFRHF